jgi:hypothetical protein
VSRGLEWSEAERRTELITGGTPPRAVRTFGIRNAEVPFDARSGRFAPGVPPEPANCTRSAYADWRTETLGLIGPYGR